MTTLNKIIAASIVVAFLAVPTTRVLADEPASLARADRTESPCSAAWQLSLRPTAAPTTVPRVWNDKLHVRPAVFIRILKDADGKASRMNQPVLFFDATPRSLKGVSRLC